MSVASCIAAKCNAVMPYIIVRQTAFMIEPMHAGTFDVFAFMSITISSSLVESSTRYFTTCTFWYSQASKNGVYPFCYMQEKKQHDEDNYKDNSDINFNATKI